MTRRSKGLLDPSSGDAVAVLMWLSEHPVPAGPSSDLDKWRAEARTLGKRAVPALVHALEYGPIDVQYSAQQVLRELGIEVWAHGYGSELFYSVAEPGKRGRRIEPVLKDTTAIEPVRQAAGSTSEAATPYRADPFEQIAAAGEAIEQERARMRSLGRVRAKAVRELLDSGVSRSEIAMRLGVHPNYVNQLAKGARPPPASRAKRRVK